MEDDRHRKRDNKRDKTSRQTQKNDVRGVRIIDAHSSRRRVTDDVRHSERVRSKDDTHQQQKENDVQPHKNKKIRDEVKDDESVDNIRASQQKNNDDKRYFKHKTVNTVQRNNRQNTDVVHFSDCQKRNDIQHSEHHNDRRPSKGQSMEDVRHNTKNNVSKRQLEKEPTNQILTRSASESTIASHYNHEYSLIRMDRNRWNSTVTNRSHGVTNECEERQDARAKRSSVRRVKSSAKNEKFRGEKHRHLNEIEPTQNDEDEKNNKQKSEKRMKQSAEKQTFPNKTSNKTRFSVTNKQKVKNEPSHERENETRFTETGRPMKQQQQNDVDSEECNTKSRVKASKQERALKSSTKTITKKLQEILDDDESRRKSRNNKRNTSQLIQRGRSRERHHHSDSEIEQSRARTHNIDESHEKSIDHQSSFYSFFNEQSHSATEHETTRKRRGEEFFDTKDNTNRRNPSQRNRESEEFSESEQSQIRNKLIKVLFKRVKELLKETEQLRDDRKRLSEKIEYLTNEVERLKMSSAEQSRQEANFKERLDIIAESPSLTWKGKTVREEIQSILHNIQRNYATHMHEHEKKIQAMQSSAETEIQTLMENIVGKFGQINEIRDRTTEASESKFGGVVSRYGKPLFINTSPTDQKKYPSTTIPLQHDYNELLLRTVQPRCSSDINASSLVSFETGVMGTYTGRPTFIDWRKQFNENSLPGEYEQSQQANKNPQQHQGQRDDQQVKTFENHHWKTTETTDTRVKPTTQTNKNNNNRNSKKIAVSMIPKKVQNQHTTKEKTIQQSQQQQQQQYGDGSKEDLKEFWRHRLLQPNPTEALKKEKEGLRNPY